MIVVNFSTDAYKRPQQRLRQSLWDMGHSGLFYTKYDQINSPTHQESPYEFKIHAILKAFEFDDLVLWADSSMYLKGELRRIEEKIKAHGYFMEESGHYVDDWCNDHAREYFSLPTKSGYTMFSAGLLGLNLQSEIAKEYLKQWKASAHAGCFRGDWQNHRHDMVCGSIIASRLDMKYQRGGSHMAYIGPGYAVPGDDVVFYCQGMP